MKLIVFLILTTIFWGIAAIFDKLALGKSGPFAGLMARQFILTAVLLLVATGSGQLRGILALEGRSALFFGLSGICGGAAGLLFYYYALSIGRASLVVPITATYPLVTALLSWAILAESFTFSRMVGTACIVLGVWLVK